LMGNAYPGAGATIGGSSGVPDYYDRLRDVTVFEEQALYNGRNLSIDQSGTPTRVRQREHHDFVANDLVGQREWEPGKNSDSAIETVLPLRRLVIIDLVVDVVDCKAMQAKRSSPRASNATRLNVCAVVVETQCLRRTRCDRSSPAIDLDIPSFGGVRIARIVQATEELQCETSPFLPGESQDFTQHVRRRHDAILADVQNRRRRRSASAEGLGTPAFSRR